MASRPRLPTSVAERLGRHLEGRPDGREVLVFAGNEHVCDGRPCEAWWYSTWVSRFNKVAAAAGLEGLDTHELRHTAASLLIAAGADPKRVQQHMGHRSIKVTFDVYGHLFEDHADEVFETLDEQARAAETANLLRIDDGEVVDLPRDADTG